MNKIDKNDGGFIIVSLSNGETIGKFAFITRPQVKDKTLEEELRQVLEL